MQEPLSVAETSVNNHFDRLDGGVFHFNKTGQDGHLKLSHADCKGNVEEDAGPHDVHDGMLPLVRSPSGPEVLSWRLTLHGLLNLQPARSIKRIERHRELLWRLQMLRIAATIRAGIHTKAYWSKKLAFWLDGPRELRRVCVLMEQSAWAQALRQAHFFEHIHTRRVRRARTDTARPRDSRREGTVTRARHRFPLQVAKHSAVHRHRRSALHAAFTLTAPLTTHARKEGRQARDEGRKSVCRALSGPMGAVVEALHAVGTAAVALQQAHTK